MRAHYASRTLQALELLAFQNLSCPELAAALGTHPRTARRLLARLVADGYAEPTFDTRRRYRATLRMAALGRQLIAHAELPRTAAPYVADLHAHTGATAHLVIPSYRGAVCVVHCDEQPPQAPRADAAESCCPHTPPRPARSCSPTANRGATASSASPSSPTPTARSPRRSRSRPPPRRPAHAATPSTTANTRPGRWGSPHLSGWMTRSPLPSPISVDVGHSGPA